jgi:short-subunit dehydrogenase
MSFWKNKVVIITGSSIGIGRNIAEQITALEGKVVLNARNETRLNKAVESMKSEGKEVFGVVGDVSKYEDCQQIIVQTLTQYGKIDVLINNAGLASQTMIQDIDPSVFQSIFNVNVMGTVFMTKAALPALIETKGSVLFIGSVAGIHGIGGYSAYSSSKMALKGITESLRIELHDKEVHIGLAYVGFTENDSEKKFLDRDGNSVSLPNRSNVKQEPVSKVALRLMKMVENRTNKSVFSPIGKTTYLVHKFAPWLLKRILLNAFKKTN